MFLKTYRAGVRSFDNYSEFSLSIVHIRHFFLIYQNPDIFFFFWGGERWLQKLHAPRKRWLIIRLCKIVFKNKTNTIPS